MTTTNKLITFISALTLSSAGFAANDTTSNDNYLNMFYGHIPTVTTSPVVGTASAYDASDLIYSFSSINHDLSLLQTHQQFNNYLASKDVANTRPAIIFSGGIEGDLIAAGQFHDSTQYSTALSTAELDIAAFINSWATTYMAFDYQNVPVETGSRDPQDQVDLNLGYATIGDLNKSPVYVSVGKMYVPFGRYKSAMVTTPETESLARILDTATNLGYYKNGYYAEAFSYNSYQTDANSLSAEGGASFGYKKTDGAHPIQVGAGYVTNIADSQGMRDNGYGDDITTNFEGFDVNDQNLAHDVPGYDVYGSIGFNAFTLAGEFVSATEDFDVNDLSYNGEAAKPQALQAEIDYTTTIRSKLTTFGFMYSQTWQSLALNLPESSYNFAASTSLWQDTLQSIEYSYNENYDSDDTSGGAGSLSNGPTGGGNSNVITLELGVYF